VKKETFNKTITSWYSNNKRDLPWRNTSDPYHIWLSEIMLQQTRVNQGLPYFLTFTSHFPDILTLANAAEQEVLRLWQGLGYYSRARNLHATAKFIAYELNGKFPENYQSLIKLKGVGSYTAAAIASFSYNEKVAVVDGNVFRVLSRYFGIETDIASPAGNKEFTILANELLPDLNTSTYNQGIMEFGALQCTPKNPLCTSCPLADSCVANINKLQSILPVKIKKLKVKTRFFHYIIFEHQHKQLLHERGPKDIWQGLNEYYLIESNKTLEFEELYNNDAILKSVLNGNYQIKQISSTYKHILTHQKIFATFIVINTQFPVKIDGYQYFSKTEIEGLAKPVLLLNYINQQLI
jgi:A/G-specific adenine glycosylase